MPPITPLQVWLDNWGGVAFLAAIIFFAIAGALLRAWDSWRVRRPRRMSLWRRIRGKISY